ncbi:MAG TPA: extracellular solute-binding protein [Acidimicrobiia bacterium]|nr:extracellular solute-binding protein [Acidimicrobiia bacterium]
MKGSKPRPVARGTGGKTLRIAQPSHFVPAYDGWFDGDYVRQWGERQNVTVVVDHYPLGDMFARAQAELEAGSGHDIVGLYGSPPAVFEDGVIDHQDVVEEVEAKVGQLIPAVRRDMQNHRTSKYFAFADFWVPSMALYRTDLWNAIGGGLPPDTWGGVIEGGARLKDGGTPVGIGFGAGVDPGLTAFGLLFAHGASLQDEGGRLVLDRPATVQAVDAAVRLFRSAMTDEVLVWDDASDNRFLASGEGAFTLDPVSAVRAIEGQNPALAEKIGLRPAPAGPAARLYPHAVQTYMIFKFSPNQELAKQFLVDLTLGYREAFLRSEFYNLPAFPGSVPDLNDIVAAEAGGKYRLLADASTWSTNLGHPGDTSPAVAEVFHEGILSKMVAAAARAELTPEDAVKRAHAQAVPIFDKWRERGKI